MKKSGKVYILMHFISAQTRINEYDDAALTGKWVFKWKWTWYLHWPKNIEMRFRGDRNSPRMLSTESTNSLCRHLPIPDSVIGVFRLSRHCLSLPTTCATFKLLLFELTSQRISHYNRNPWLASRAATSVIVVTSTSVSVKYNASDFFTLVHIWV